MAGKVTGNGSLQGDGPSYCPLLPTSHQCALTHSPSTGAGSQHSLPTQDRTLPCMGQCPLPTNTTLLILCKLSAVATLVVKSWALAHFNTFCKS